MSLNILNLSKFHFNVEQFDTEMKRLVSNQRIILFMDRSLITGTGDYKTGGGGASQSLQKVGGGAEKVLRHA